MQALSTSAGAHRLVWQRFKKNKPAFWSFRLLLVFSGIAFLAPLLANDQPLYIQLNGQSFFPALSFTSTIEMENEGVYGIWQKDIIDWKKVKAEKVVWCPIAYAPNKSDFLNADYCAPTAAQQFKTADGEVIEMPRKFRHWLGTNKRGEDVLSGLLHGFRISLSIGVLAMLIAAIIGITIGAAAGYFGDTGLTTSKAQFYTFPFQVLLAYFYAFQTRGFVLTNALQVSSFQLLWQLLLSLIIFIVVLFGLNKVVKFSLGRISFLKTKSNIPLDSLLSRLIEIVLSLPTLILIITIAAIARPSIVNIILLIGLVQWTSIARFTRAEMLKVREMDYITAAKVLGYSQFRIIVKHALPNAIAPALISIAFGIAGAILTESSLSFLGVGLPADVVTWGTLINSGRENFDAWWLVLFPGICIFLTVLIYNLIGEGLRDALDPKIID